jgi:regulator of cell morphogenesis and NO signaling
MNIDGRLPIAKLAAETPGARAVFESFGLDYACAGNRSLDDAAHAEGIAPSVVLDALRHWKGSEKPPQWNEWSLSALTRHLAEQHHRLVRDELSHLAVRMAEICTTPDGLPSYLLALREAFRKLSDLLLPHFHEEEEVSFRVIEALERTWQSGGAHATTIAALEPALRVLVEEHGAISAQLRIIRELRLRLDESESLTLQCSSVLDDLAALEAHLHEFMFVENCVLFPRASALAEHISKDAEHGAVTP